LALQPEL